jgi:hypothetical protein
MLKPTLSGIQRLSELRSRCAAESSGVIDEVKSHGNRQAMYSDKRGKDGMAACAHKRALVRRKATDGADSKLSCGEPTQHSEPRWSPDRGRFRELKRC